MTWKLAKEAILQISAALYEANMHKRRYCIHTAANFGSIESRHYGIGKESKLE